MQGQVEREGAALPKDARKLDLSAEQHGKLSTDSEPKAGTAVLARGARVGLLEGFENEPLLFESDADAGVLNGEGTDLRGCVEHRMISTPTLRGKTDTNHDLTVSGELDGVGEQILQDLLEPLRIGVHESRQVLGNVHVEWETLGFRHVPEIAIDGVAQAGK